MSNPNGAPEPDFDSLYRDVILDHYRAPHGRAPIARADGKADGMNPSCGDEVDVEFALSADGRLEALQVHGRGCAISVSSGSILHDLIVGATPAEARRILAAVKSVLQGAPIPQDPNLGDFDALEGVQKFPVRIKCALLPWTTLEEALRDFDQRTESARQNVSHAGHERGEA